MACVQVMARDLDTEKRRRFDEEEALRVRYTGKVKGGRF